MGMIIFLVCISLFLIGLDYFPFTTKSTDTDKKTNSETETANCKNADQPTDTDKKTNSETVPNELKGCLKTIAWLALISIILYQEILIPFINKLTEDYEIVFPEKGECLTSKNLTVFQSLPSTKALVYGEDFPQAMLLKNNEGIAYYDKMVIKISPKKCARQIGVYRYKTKSKEVTTIPIVIIDTRNK